MNGMQNLEKVTSKHPHAVVEAESGAEPAEYLEFLALNDRFQGDSLRRLTVSVYLLPSPPLPPHLTLRPHLR